MSIIHTIKSGERFDLFYLLNQLKSIDADTILERRGDDVLYFYIDKKSTRGVDITISKNEYEIRNTVLSNYPDYTLTNRITNILLRQLDGDLFNEDNELIKTYEIFPYDTIINNQFHDAQLLFQFMNEQTVTIYSPVRQVYFGKAMHKFFQPFEKDKTLLFSEMEKVVLHTQNNLPDYGYGDILKIKDKDITIKVLANKVNYLVGKYNYIMLSSGYDDDKPIMITNDILNSILPDKWKLVDEYTIVAPIIPTDEWNNFLIQAKKYDSYDEFNKK